ncbi:MAG: ParB/Srx family N-terminal domain-containing protein [Magnetococcales bacterium]|nr:ParB/Srx family N-terminal domain-containing protein [Magnetococcales bacterium]
MHMIKSLLAATVALSMAGAVGVAGAKDDDKDKGLPKCDDKTKVAKANASGVITGDEREKKGCQIKVEDLHPTQSAVGLDAVQCKSEKLTAKYDKKPSKYEDYLADTDRFVPLVRGPKGKFYLTDHHHLSAGVWNANVPDKEKEVNAYLLADWSTLNDKDFWTLMQANHDTWLKNPAGKEITPDQLPDSIAKLVDDPMRTLSAWVRNSCGYVKCDAATDDSGDDDETTCAKKFPKVTCADAYFLEFNWGAYLATVPEIKKAIETGEGVACPQKDVLTSQCLESQYDKLVKVLPAAMKAAADPAALKALGEGSGYNAEAQVGTPQPKNCATK